MSLMDKFSVRLAKTAEEVTSAQRLRFEVFNKEMGCGLKEAFASGLDRDAYDELCDHILIIDSQTQATIGTYRLLLRSRLKGARGFYSEGEFDLSRIHSLHGEIMEMGRSCVRKDYRRNAVLNLLWQGILDYMKRHKVAYCIGCPSVYTKDPAPINKVYSLLRRDHFAPEFLRVEPRSDKRVPGLREVAIAGHERRIMLYLPALIRSYLKIGAVVCGPPALDEDFGTVDFFMLLDVSRISGEYLKRFDLRSAA